MKTYRDILLIGLLCLLLVVWAGCNDDDNSVTDSSTTSLTISSTAFGSGATIPLQYTCDGIDSSPPLQWSDVSQDTQSFVLIMDDPDAPGGTFVHWVLYNVPATTTMLAEAVSLSGSLPAGSLEGINDFGALGYSGPCPPSGENHRYYFRLYALDVTLGLAAGAERSEVDQAMSGRILAEAVLMGTFSN